MLAPKHRVNEACSKIIDLPVLICTDQTDRFLVRSKSFNYFMIVFCDYDINAMLGEAMLDRKLPFFKKCSSNCTTKYVKRGTN